MHRVKIRHFEWNRQTNKQTNKQEVHRANKETCKCNKPGSIFLVVSDGLYCYLLFVNQSVCFTTHSRQTRLMQYFKRHIWGQVLLHSLLIFVRVNSNFYNQSFLFWKIVPCRDSNCRSHHALVSSLTRYQLSCPVFIPSSILKCQKIILSLFWTSNFLERFCPI